MGYYDKSNFLKSILSDDLKNKCTLYNKLGEALDWFLSETRFESNVWGKIHFEDFLNKVKAVIKIEEKNYFFGENKASLQNKIPQKQVDNRIVYVIFSRSNKCERGESLAKRIRNGIAHGHTQIIDTSDGWYIRIEDYYNKAQTAYINFPLNCIVEIYNVYKKMDRSIKSKRKK